MKKIITCILLGAALFSSCGPSAEELAVGRKKKQDSLTLEILKVQLRTLDLIGNLNKKVDAVDKDLQDHCKNK